jgi:organic radical activating enzyme
MVTNMLFDDIVGKSLNQLLSLTMCITGGDPISSAKQAWLHFLELDELQKYGGISIETGGSMLVDTTS